MRKAFTLVELLIVVVVIVTLMTIVFRLVGVGDDATQRNSTINRMQRLENCLSGYYAAYGSYPPVKLHGSRDYRLKVDKLGMQSESEKESELQWKSVEAACRSQPLGMAFPFHETWKDYVEAYSQNRASQNSADTTRVFEALYDNSIVSSHGDKTDWRDLQLYKFGVLSYLLPRYLVIMGGGFTNEDRSQRLDDQLFTGHKQWTENNQLPPDFDTGMPYASWGALNSMVNSEPWKVAAIPSQAACARWLPNLDGVVSSICSRKFYGVEIAETSHYNMTEVHSPGGYNSTSQQYCLDTLTVKDGYWDSDRSIQGVEFYYYSPPPHQTYRLWSSGKNCRTFPPWVSNEELQKLSSKDRKSVQQWISDDIVHMSN